MNDLHIKMTEELNEQIMKYAALKKVNKSQAVRELIAHGLDVTANESDILKEIKALRADVKDTQSILQKNTDRLVKLSVKNLKYVLATWHLVLITIFFRSKDKGMSDDQCVNAREDASKYAMKYALRDLNDKSDS